MFIKGVIVGVIIATMTCIIVYAIWTDHQNKKSREWLYKRGMK